MILAICTGIAILLLGLALWTIVVRDTFAAVAGFIPYGLLLTLAWLVLAAVDVALTEAAIGAGLTGALLIRAASRLHATEAAAQAEEPSLATRVAAAVLASAVAGVIAACLLSLPDPAPSLAPDVSRQIQSTGVGNPITAVLLSFRAIDTLLEAIALLFGVVGVWSLAPDRYWGGRPGLAQAVGPNDILVYLARVLPPVGVVIGIYIFWVGADHPGGKFQGATVIAAMWLLVMMSGLRDAPAVSWRWLRVVLVVGPAIFIALGLLGAALAGAFLAYPDGWAKVWIIVIEVALLPSLAVTLVLLLVGPPQRPEVSA
ncbi:hydrogenase subunit MbhD domain-containing protein [Paraburkholderia rhizosphaerae]|uniref:Multisubunit sodium/proton antiporter MrpB subunit n=1 Tax=Paraburkholderia rhizosphaerae TaxID=480658 RepID=A0A4R8LLH8_9BURK|nr:hydrogenase subunit MbhD domain-containing protein [Paraburkholderia rhizosphaerae]TDY45392.1 multisubunit sodium/proton antiporter MrpB subunit [Paraburkholderia rhizosphaerae]